MKGGIRESALAYLREGMWPVPIPAGRKGPVLRGWQDLRILEADVARYFDEGDNIGVHLGEPSGDLVDVDLDAPEAVAAARDFLPATDRVHGREGKPHSHYWYRSSPAPRRITFEEKSQEGEKDGESEKEKNMICEIRGTGVQTMVPPSRRPPTGDAVVWHQHGPPARVDPDALYAAVACVATAALLARHWPGEGTRQETALAVAGFLLRGELPEELAARLVRCAARVAGDTDELDMREGAVASTSARLADAKAVTGGPSLADLLTGDGEAVVRLCRKWLKLGSGRPALHANDRDIPRATADAWKALVGDNDPPRLFVVAGAVARVQPGTGMRPEIEVLTLDRLSFELARAADYYTLSRATKAEDAKRIPAAPPQPILRDMLADPKPPLPALTRIVQMPTFRPDGSILLTPGYDPASQVWYAPPAGFHARPVPDRPTANQITAARDLLVDEWLPDFPFAGKTDLANVMAMLLLPFVRELIDGPTPLHLIEKPTPGTGASLLTEVITVVATGTEVAPTSEAESDAEWRKRITALLLEAPAAILLDNLRRRLDSGALAAALTTKGEWKDRKMGESVIVRAQVRCLWIATANNPSLSTEMSRRTARIRLEPKVERPWQRSAGEFRHPDLRKWTRDHRAELTAAVMTLVQAWVVAGRPAGARTLGMFESWASVIGGILATAGIPDFLTDLTSVYEESDFESGQWSQFVAAWWNRFADKEVTISLLWSLVAPADGDPLDLGLRDGTERSMKTQLGARLVSMRGRRFGEYVLQPVGAKKQGATVWKLIRVAEPVPPPDGEPCEPREPVAPSRPYDDPGIESVLAGEEDLEKGSRGSRGSPPHPPTDPAAAVESEANRNRMSDAKRALMWTGISDKELREMSEEEAVRQLAEHEAALDELVGRAGEH